MFEKRAAIVLYNCRFTLLCNGMIFYAQQCFTVLNRSLIAADKTKTHND